MKVSVTKREDHRALLEVEVEAERLRKELEAAYRRLVRQVDVPGFRRGKAPRFILERHVGKGRLLQQALDRLLPEAYREAMREAGVDVVGEPRVSVKQVREGEPLLLEIEVLLLPEAEIESWDDIVVDAAAPQVTEAEIEEQLERLRQQHATLVSVENGEARPGDQLVVDWQYEPGEDAKDFPRSRQGVVIPVEDPPESTEGLPAEVVAALVGARRGESRELGGYRVTVREVKRPELAELTDEFARQLGKFDTLQDLKKAIENSLLRVAVSRIRQEQEAKITDELLHRARVDVPEPLVDSELDSLLRRIEEQRGAKFDEEQAASLRVELRPVAERNLRRELVLETIARREGLWPGEEEMERVTRRLAQEGESVAQTRERLDKLGIWKALERTVARSKAMDFLLSKATRGEHDGVPGPDGGGTDGQGGESV